MGCGWMVVCSPLHSMILPDSRAVKGTSPIQGALVGVLRQHGSVSRVTRPALDFGPPSYRQVFL